MLEKTLSFRFTGDKKTSTTRLAYIMPIIAKRCGIKFDPPSVVLIYEDEHTNKLRKRIMPVRSFSQYSGNTPFPRVVYSIE